MLSREQYIAFTNVIALSIYNKRITIKEGNLLANRHDCVKQAVIFGVPVETALTINEHHAIIFNKLYLDASVTHDPYPICLLQESLRITNSLQSWLVIYRNFSVDNAIILCPDLTESSVASFYAMEAAIGNLSIGNLSIENAMRFSNESQVSMLKNIIYTKMNSYISEEDVNIALRFNSDYYYVFEVLLSVDDNPIYNHDEYLDLINQALTFRSEQIDILRLMNFICDVYKYPKDTILGNKEAIIDIVKLLHPDNKIMKRAIGKIEDNGDSEIDTNEAIYQDIINDLKEEVGDLYNLLEHYGFITQVAGEDYYVVAQSTDLDLSDSSAQLLGDNSE